LLFVAGLLIWVLSALAAGRRDIAAQNANISGLANQLEAVRNAQDTHTQTLEKNLREGQNSIGKYLQSSLETMTKLHRQIANVENAGRQMLQVGDEVRKLQDIFKNPKHRGQLGEQSLEQLLGQVLPQESFQLQHTFANGRMVDALVTMPGYTVPIDAKFPLPGFEKMLAAEEDTARAAARRQFLSDVSKHIDKIAASYILPDEGTLDFALMYIPAENVYYETVVRFDKDRIDLMEEAMRKKVIPVSPNLLYAYLMTVAMGLRGLQIEKQAAQIRRMLEQLGGQLVGFSQTWEVLGKHLRNAQGQYDEGNRKLENFRMNLQRIHAREEESDKLPM
jgi:DNA recombination protein RmuC